MLLLLLLLAKYEQAMPNNLATMLLVLPVPVQLLQQVRHSVHRVTDSAEAAAMLKTKEVGSTATFTGALEIGDHMKISVKVPTSTPGHMWVLCVFRYCFV